MRLSRRPSRRTHPDGRLPSSRTGVVEPDADASYVAEAITRADGTYESDRAVGRRCLESAQKTRVPFSSIRRASTLITVSYIGQPDLPRILMLDCTDELVASVRGDGYHVKVGYTGCFNEHPAVSLPERLHEIDLLIVDLDPGWEPRPAETLYPTKQQVSPGISRPVADADRVDNLRNTFYPRRNLDRFISAFERGALVVCLMEAATVAAWGNPLTTSFRWLAGSDAATVGLSDDAAFRAPATTPTFFGAVAELQKLFADSQGMRGIRTLARVSPLLVNDAGETKAGWEDVASDEAAGGFLYLPWFEYKSTVVRRLLRDVLPKQTPELFLERNRTDWQEDDRYQLAGVLDVRRRRRAAEDAHRRALEELQNEEAVSRAEQEQFAALLTATSDDLRVPVQRALEWLEFEEVIDEDERRARAGIGSKDEDFHLKDSDYFAVVELTSGRGGAHERDYGDLAKYRQRRQKDPGREDINAADIRGLLIMNQHVGTEPRARPDLFEGNENNYQELATGMEVGLLSTYDLFMLIRLVDMGQLTKAKAREIIKTSGLVKAPVSDGDDQ